MDSNTPKPKTNRRRRLRAAALTALAVVALVGLGVYLGVHGAEVRQLLTANPKLLLGVLAVCVLRLYITGLANRTMFNARGLPIASMECFHLASVTNACNMVLPLQSGAAFRAVYLRRKHSFAYVDFIATMFGTQLMFFTVTSAVALVCIGLFTPPTESHGRTIGMLLAGSCLTVGVVVSLLPRLKPRGVWFFDKLAAVTQGWYELRRDRLVMLKVLAIALALRGCDALCFWFGCRAAGLEIPLLPLVALTSVGATASVVSITPSGLGTFELVVGIVSGAAGLTPVQAVSVSVMCRSVAVLGTAIIAPISLWRLSRFTAVKPAERSVAIPNSPRRAEPLARPVRNL